MKLRVVWFGRPAASPFESEIETYRRRVARRWPAEDVPLRPAAPGRGDEPLRALAREAAAIRDRVPAGWSLLALDRRGRQLDSEQLADLLAAVEQRGGAGVVLAIGSDLGLDRTLCDQADERVALSRLTLPHLVARLVVWEQVFRATHILGGGGYHRPDVQ